MSPLSYRDSGGAGSPVVLLHGGASSAATWDRFGAALAAAGRRTIAVDLRGHGGSPRAATYPLTGFRDDVTGLLDVLGLDRIALVGHSLGAHTASLVAQACPDRVSHLVLEELPVPGGLSGRRFLLPALLLLAARRGFDPRAMISVVRQLSAPDPAWWDRLASITAPTLVVSGGPRSHIPPARLAEVTRAIPAARLVTIPVGHRVHSLDPARFHAAVVPFLT
ncbi:dihydrolipoamide acetyltransferase [Asanoa ishikariensis]|uniref:Pimeloyl-ACP methyl ester carboxylesterase n=1 Tax=Asanoa ishikariensis TaxID=137265 RepID=A0A1H3NU26_9ACTN|nr:alpha/beta hydrolase [Asanoa ishikariensis]GIF68352.1 dihydrolipoamide acetyltransferase [Asanoa ishikariensis]SDY92427.1 Pimeloyl-ACP methyl ester carboxylesterase [Asanoa ishikariensis]